jgi:hypothetical protein
MYENFGAVISPSTDLVTVAYMSDQPSGTTADDRVMVATAPSPSQRGRANQRGGG